MTDLDNSSYLRKVLIKLTGSLIKAEEALKSLSEIDEDFNEIEVLKEGSLKITIHLKGNPKGLIEFKL